jgi:hypothetical protein
MLLYLRVRRSDFLPPKGMVYWLPYVDMVTSGLVGRLGATPEMANGLASVTV